MKKTNRTAYFYGLACTKNTKARAKHLLLMLLLENAARVYRESNNAENARKYAHFLMLYGRITALSVIKKMRSFSGMLSGTRKASNNGKNDTIRTAEKKAQSANVLKQLEQWEKDVIMCNFNGEGFDFVNVAIVAFLDEERKAHERNVNTCFLWTQKEYAEIDIDKRVIIQRDDSMKKREFTRIPARNVYQKLREYIVSNRGVRIDEKHVFIEEIVQNEDGTEEQLFHRLKNGMQYAYYDYVEKHENTCNLLQASIVIQSFLDTLTANETKLLDLKLCGNGYKAIASYTGKKADTVKKCFQSIRKKAEKSGLLDIASVPDESNEKHVNTCKTCNHIVSEYEYIANEQRKTTMKNVEKISKYVIFATHEQQQKAREKQNAEKARIYAKNAEIRKAKNNDREQREKHEFTLFLQYIETEKTAREFMIENVIETNNDIYNYA